MSFTRADVLRLGIGSLCAAITGPHAIAAPAAPLKIGVLTDLSGAYSDAAGLGAVEAARMAIEETQAQFPNAPVELVSADHQNKPDIGVAVARNWFDREGVSAVFELVSSAVALAVQDLAKDRGRLSVVTGAATSTLTRKACSPFGMHWVFDTYAVAKPTALELLRAGQDKWFFITADYAFGTALEADTTEVLAKAGGKVVGSVRHPLGAHDFSSVLLQAQGSNANVIAFANGGKDLQTALKQAGEFWIGQNGQKLAVLLATSSEIYALGPEATGGLYLTEAFYWDANQQSRQWSNRFFERRKRMPNSIQAGTYSAVRHFLRSAASVQSTDAATIAAAMRKLPVEDAFTENGKVRADGRMTHDMFFVRVKQLHERKSEWDLYEVVSRVPSEQAFRPASTAECPLVL